ncbi:MAG: Serine/threonine kinase with two-component sensor domain protein, partial [Labilithrix sp.]|nr:Serine/threonine kinase with two-component sensor domain protein [Labilithrix sp.]
MTRQYQTDRGLARGRSARRPRKPAPRLDVRELSILLQSDRETRYRAKTLDGRPVIVDELTSSSTSEVDRVAQAFELMRAIRSRATLRPLATTTHDGHPAIVYEDFLGAPLSVGRAMETREFLRVAERITAALGEIHHANVIHKDIRPDNILVDQATGIVKITGFGLATRLPRELSGSEMPRLVEGSLPYMSPEQTGRVNRAVDSRSDLYSLGVVFFEMLTGRLPFDAHDTLAWVHSHVARPAPSPRALVGTVPEVLAEIVLKLLSKRAESRYQTASGLAADLAHCGAALDELGRIDRFPLAARDVPDRLQLPQKLYGREAEIATLDHALARVVGSGRPELVLVSGYSGAGKSALVHELVHTVAESGGLFLSGKFEQFNHGTSNLAIADSFRAPVREVLGGEANELAAWRRRMSEALGAGARLVTDVIPELSRVLGQPPPSTSSGLLEDGQRFYATFTRFVSAFSERRRPMVLFLDDLQWSDQGSLRLLEYLLAEVAIPILVVGAYRDNELPEAHPLHSTLERLRAANRLVDHVHVGPLGLPHLTSLVADTIRRPEGEARSLARVLFAKTGGNPLFVHQFLHEL